MKVIILAGGLGTRISEETANKPKPMVLIAGKPMLWHIMSIFASQGFNEFIVAAGYKGEVIREWAKTISEPWNIQIIDTGQDTQTGGRIAQCLDAVNDDRAFVT
jgi:glucose-1-phosphate cytidylyltransferase